MKRIIILVASILGALSFNATAGDYSPNTYQPMQAMQGQNVEGGVVLNIRNVVIQGQSTTMQYTTTAVGSSVGMYAAQRIANPNVRMIATVLLTAGGGYAANKLGEVVSRQDAQELIVKLDSGRITAITQEADGNLHVNQHIYLIGNSRVVPAI